MKKIVLHTEEGTLRLSVQEAREYIADYRNSEDRTRRGIAMDLEDLLEDAR